MPDYDKLAAQFGAVGLDKYDQLAKKFSGSASAQPVSSSDIPLSPGAAQRMAAEQASRQPAPEDNLLGKAFGLIEPAIAMGTGLVGGFAGAVRGGPLGAPFSNAKNARELENEGGKLAEYLTYQPRTQTGRQITGAIGSALSDSGIIGVPLPELSTLGRAASSSANAARGLAGANAGAMAAQDASMLNGGRQSLRELVGAAPKPVMSGGGAALTRDALLRTQRAADLPVPIPLTKGQAERTFELQRFERETAKLPIEGEPLRQRFADQNGRMLQNFDAFGDQTGAEQGSLRLAGKKVIDALEMKRAQKKSEINRAYQDARDAGHMAEPVDVGPLSAFIEDNRPAALNAPILNSVEAGIKKLDPKGIGQISLNDLEELRQMTGDLAQPGTPNAAYGARIKGLIDNASEGKGGPQYQQARRLYENYSNEFGNRDVIDKMLRTKPGTKDRAVAYEDVFSHAILKGSRDDVSAVRRTLQTAGPAGEQAWKELQGQTINHIKETVTANSARDINGMPIVSPDKLNKLVRNLDEDGKLDFVFGKEGAQKIRDVNDLAKDVYTSPPGSVNTSNTASVLIGLLDTAVSGVSGMPLPIGTAINYGVKRVKSNSLKKRVADTLNAVTPYPTRP